jgi:hypothetical protein
MNQSIRKFLSSGFDTWARFQIHLRQKMLALLYWWSIAPLFGNGGDGDQGRKAVKIVIYPFGAHLLPIHIETDLLYDMGIG